MLIKQTSELLTGWIHRSRRAPIDGARRLLRDIAVAALIIQMAHLIEHMAQLTYWSMNPSEAPWLTPWAVAGRDLLAVDGTPAGGNEILHLLGNVIFLGGILALGALVWRSGRKAKEVPYLSQAIILQGIHVAEHILLTVSYLAFGSVIGFSTIFGTAQGVFGSSLRIWAHFLLNLTATYYAVRSVSEMHRRGLLVQRPSHRSRSLPLAG